MTESPSSSRGLLARIAQSAEYSIAAALLLVCAVVGASLWWLSPAKTDEADVIEATNSAAAGPAADEREALDEAKRRLGERFSAIDEQQRRRTAEDESRRERQKAEAASAAAEARREAELAAQARQQAELRAPEAAPRAAAPPAPAPVVKRPVEIVDAAIDWSSCRRPQYPSGSVRRSEEGVVVIAADLDAAANIRQTRITQSSGHEALDRVTLEAVGKCRFTPAREDGVAKAATAQVRFNWKLQK